jgi:ribosome-binding factor A
MAESVTRARTFVAHQLRLRHVPTLEFVPDTVPGQGARIDRLLAELATPEDEPGVGAPVGRDQEGSGA